LEGSASGLKAGTVELLDPLLDEMSRDEGTGMATGAEIGAGGERERPEVEDGHLEGGLVG
jgi:hypothetical protein